MTQDLELDPPSGKATTPHLKRIGRYRIRTILGEGGFGIVYLGHDDQLDRPVAIKVPHAQRILAAEDAEAYLDEARAVARLDHPGIVPVHDVGSTDECPCFVVSKYVEGTNLAATLKKRQFNYHESAELIATVAEALHYAHKQGLVHRDVKPGNIIIGTDGKPHVVDFGLALREENIGTGPKIAGTPAYMSPEQARGEGHRVDGRSDVFSLGTVLYQLLAGRKPFRGDSQAELLDQVTTLEPRPLRQYDERLPKELERICHKAMAKRASQRYSSAYDLADDLRHFLSEHTELQSGTTPATDSPSTTETMANGNSTSVGTVAESTSSAGSVSIGLGSSDGEPARIVPKGLRSFDTHDADFFLELLPGPRDRYGLPDGLRFWKTRVEEKDPDNTFSVGLIYGPSGCGKSSMVKAGLLPRLSPDVLSVYLEATPDETESRLLHGIRKRCPAVDESLSLTETLATVRRGLGLPIGKKVLIVIDQFEQWLHAHKDDDAAELVRALRQCDGARVQCIVMVRDDFWLAVSRFLHDLEVRLVEGLNVSLVDLFDVDHARRVLAAFGRAFGRLPENIDETTKEQKEFLTRSVESLSEEGKVICVRLALFAEMMKGKPWTVTTLKDVGGTAGVGATFLEETFSSASASPEHRYHQKAARAVLDNLLPDSGANIKGYMRSYTDLRAASGYENRPKDFEDLIRILDSEVRLITPTDPEGLEGGDVVTETDPGKKYYQLAHDYLVRSLRDWLTRKQKETRQGRAQLLLADRSAAWNARAENRLLPSWWENLNIRLFSDKKKWTASQRTMMSKAGVVHGVRTLIAVVLLAAVLMGGVAVRNSARNRQRDAEATRLVNGLLQADTSQVASIIADLEDYRTWANDDLATAINGSDDGSNAKLHAALATLPQDDSVLPFLKERLLTVSPFQFEHVRNLLEPRSTDLTSDYWKLVSDKGADPSRRFQAATALASFDPENEQWREAELAQAISNHLVSVLPSHLLPWRNALRPIHKHLTGPLAAIYRDSSRGEQVRSFATDTLADYLANDADQLFELLADSTQQQFNPIFDTLGPHTGRMVALAATELAKTPAAGADEVTKETLARRQANVAIMLLRVGAGEHVWPLLRFSPDPRVRSYIIHWLSPRGGDANALLGRFEEESDVTIKRALLQCLGEFDEARFETGARDALIKKLLDVYRDEPDAGLHASAEWLLREWGQAEKLAVTDSDLRQSYQQRQETAASTKKWFLNSEGHSFVILDAGEFRMGSPESEPDHYGNEVQHLAKINRRIAVSAKLVTKSQYREFSLARELEYSSDRETLQVYMPAEDCPIISMRWYEACEYCNWLSKKDGIPEDQWCYEPNKEGEYVAGMKAKDNFLELTGYRLLTEAEWEYSCRAGTTTSRYYGLAPELLGEYAWFAGNNKNCTEPVGTRKPNDFGLFDMQGNCFEWCYDQVLTDLSDKENADIDPLGTEPTTDTDNRILRGGGFVIPPANMRSAARYFAQPKNRRLQYGFRTARTLPAAD